MKNKIVMSFVVLAFVLMFVTACANLGTKASETSQEEDSSSGLITGQTTKDTTEEPVEEEVEETAEEETAEEETTDTEETTEEEAEEGVVEVSITESGFDPRTVNIKVGDTVKWTNNRAEIKAMLIGVRELFNMRSPVLEPGESFTWKFDEAGYFSYVGGIYTHYDGNVAVNE